MVTILYRNLYTKYWAEKECQLENYLLDVLFVTKYRRIEIYYLMLELKNKKEIKKFISLDLVCEFLRQRIWARV